MCTYDILASSPTGYIARCSKCHNLEMVFGTSLSVYPEGKLPEFLAFVERMLEEDRQANPIQKRIILNLASTEALQMILNPQELQQLHDMLDRALDEIRARSLLNLFNVSESP